MSEENKIEITLAVLGNKMDSLKELVELKFKSNEKQHTELISHQKITNGRVNRCEEWQSKALGAFIIVNIILLPIIFMIINKHL